MPYVLVSSPTLLVPSHNAVDSQTARLLCTAIHTHDPLCHNYNYCYSNTLYIFSEWVPGGSLRDVLDDFGPLRETVARDYARQVQQQHHCCTYAR
jgi:serine/threonine protein kinase